jgi:hypothetical protein
MSSKYDLQEVAAAAKMIDSPLGINPSNLLAALELLDRLEDDHGKALQMKRLEAIDAIGDFCSWDKGDHGCNEIELAARKLWRLLMAQCSKWETKMGY